MGLDIFRIRGGDIMKRHVFFRGRLVQKRAQVPHAVIFINARRSDIAALGGALPFGDIADFSPAQLSVHQGDGQALPSFLRH